MKRIIYILLVLSTTAFSQVKVSKNDLLKNVTTGIGTPSTNSVTANTGDEYLNTTTGDKFRAINSAWTVNVYAAQWSATTTITIGAVTTAPTKATTKQNDFVRYRVKNPPIGTVTALVEADYQYSATSSTGAADGSGFYLFTLPDAYQFNTTEYTFYTGTAKLNELNMSIYAVNRGKPCGMVCGGGLYDEVVVIPYDATRFRLLTYGSTQYISNTWFQMTQSNKSISLNFDFYIQ